MTMPAPHEPCCECFECARCDVFPEFFAAVISGVRSTAQCDACEDANVHYGLYKIPCDSVPCGWYAFEPCQFRDPSCGQVELVELDIWWSLDQGTLVTHLDLMVQFGSAGYWWTQEVREPFDCCGELVFTANDLVYGWSPCDYSEVTIELTAAETNPCL